MTKENVTVEILDNTPNKVIVQLSNRNYPGIIIQGDTLQSLLTMSEEERITELQRLHDHYCKVAVKKII